MPLELHLFGHPELVRDGMPLDFRLRRGLALLSVLALTPGGCDRDALVALLWPEAGPTEGRARLRRTLHRLQRAADRPLVAGGAQRLALAPGTGLRVDVQDFRARLRQAGSATAPGGRPRAALEAAVALYRGDFLAGFHIPDADEFHRWQYYHAENLRQALGHALERLARAHAAAGNVPLALTHARRRLELDPLHEAAHRMLMRLLAESGQYAAALRQFEQCRGLLLEELGIAPDRETSKLAHDIALRTVAPVVARSDGAGSVRYTTSGDVHVAYRVVGARRCPLVLLPGFVSHLDLYWSQPELAHFTDALVATGGLVVFDKRGMGLSDRVGYAPTPEHTAADLLAVLDSAGLGKVVLLGVSEGGPAAVTFAARHPQRVAGLVLYGTLARALHCEDYPWGAEEADFDRRVRVAVADWGGPAFIEVFAPSWAADPARRAWWGQALRLAASPAAVCKVFEALKSVDVRPLLPTIACPTLVLHRAGDRALVPDHGRYLAARIPGARFVELPGNDHWWWVGETAPTLDAIGRFLRGPVAAHAIHVR